MDLTPQAVSMIAASFSSWAKQQIEACIMDNNMPAALWVLRPTHLPAGLRHEDQERASAQLPYLSIHTLRCIYSEHSPTIEKPLSARGWNWMLRTNLIWNGTPLQSLSAMSLPN